MEDSEKMLRVLEQTAHFSAFYVGNAANADELERILSEVKAQISGRLTCMFGPADGEYADSLCNLGIAAGKYADVTVLTEDPGGADDFDKAVETIAGGITVVGGSCRVIPDRVEAIHFLLDQSGRKDAVLLLRRKTDRDAGFLTDEQIVEQYLGTK